MARRRSRPPDRQLRDDAILQHSMVRLFEDPVQSPCVGGLLGISSLAPIHVLGSALPNLRVYEVKDKKTAKILRHGERMQLRIKIWLRTDAGVRKYNHQKGR